MKPPFVIWFTGLSSSGKTTLSKNLHSTFEKEVVSLVLLDGDDIRTAFGEDLGHGQDDRFTQIRRIQNISKILVDQGISVIVAALYANEELLLWNRKYLKNYFEIYLQASIKTVMSRDTKNLYAPAINGNLKNVVGVDIGYDDPKSPDIIIDMDRPNNVSDTIRHLTDRINLS